MKKLKEWKECRDCVHFHFLDPAWGECEIDDYRMLMHRCGRCVHWEDEHYPLSPGWGLCKLGGTKDGEPIYETKARAQDYEAYCGYLETRWDFYCCQFEAKPSV